MSIKEIAPIYPIVPGKNDLRKRPPGKEKKDKSMEDENEKGDDDEEKQKDGDGHINIYA